MEEVKKCGCGEKDCSCEHSGTPMIDEVKERCHMLAEEIIGDVKGMENEFHQALYVLGATVLKNSFLENEVYSLKEEVERLQKELNQSTADAHDILADIAEDDRPE